MIHNIFRRKIIHGSIFGAVALAGISLSVSAHATCTQFGGPSTTQYGPYFFSSHQVIDLGFGPSEKLCAPQGFAGGFTSAASQAQLEMSTNGHYVVVGNGTPQSQPGIVIGCVEREYVFFTGTPAETETGLSLTAKAGASNRTSFADMTNPGAWLAGWSGVPSNPMSGGQTAGIAVSWTTQPTIFQLAAGSAAVNASAYIMSFPFPVGETAGAIGSTTGLTSRELPDDGGAFCFLSGITGPLSSSSRTVSLGITQEAACVQDLVVFGCSGDNCPFVRASCIPVECGPPCEF